MAGLIINDTPGYRFKDYNFLTHTIPGENAVKVLQGGKIKSFVQGMMDGNATEPNTAFRAWTSFTISFGLNYGSFYGRQDAVGFILPLRAALGENTCLTVSGFEGDPGEVRVAPLRYAEESQQLMDFIAVLRPAIENYELVSGRVKNFLEKYELPFHSIVEFCNEARKAFISKDLEAMRAIYRTYAPLCREINFILSSAESYVKREFSRIELNYKAALEARYLEHRERSIEEYEEAMQKKRKKPENSK